jgi:hypothetical protein
MYRHSLDCTAIHPVRPNLRLLRALPAHRVPCRRPGMDRQYSSLQAGRAGARRVGSQFLSGAESVKRSHVGLSELPGFIRFTEQGFPGCGFILVCGSFLPESNDAFDFLVSYPGTLRAHWGSDFRVQEEHITTPEQ